MSDQRYYVDTGVHHLGGMPCSIGDLKREPQDRIIAEVRDEEIAQRIVNLLNADAARLERQGAVAS